jgi:hypothetical protein
MLWIILACIIGLGAAEAQEVVGERPYEMVWANRTQDDHPALVDFEDLTGWTVGGKDSVAIFERTRQQQMFGQYVGKLTYRANGAQPQMRFGPAQPVSITEPFDAVSCWIYGNNWGYSPNPNTPVVNVTAVFEDAKGNDFSVPLAWVCWEEWFLCYRRLTPEQIEQAKAGAKFKGFVVTNGHNEADRTLYFDSLCTFQEAFAPLKFEPRPARGISMFPGQTVGTNTGPGKLPFPIRPETILPENLTRDFKTTLTQEGGTFVFTYAGADGKLTYRLTSKTGTWGDITAQWAGTRDKIAATTPIQPCVEGGVCLVGPNGEPTRPERMEQVRTERKGDTVQSVWRAVLGQQSAEVTFTYRLWNKSLVIDTAAPGGQVAEVRYGHAVGLGDPRLVTNPYYTYDPGRPAVAVSGSTTAPLFLMGNTDWYLSNASTLWGANVIDKAGVTYNGGTRYIPKTDGKRNDCYERFFVTVSPRFEEVLPTIANPVSPYKQVTGTHVWRAHGAGDRKSDAEFWTNCHRWGMTQVVITDHETGWDDGGESFTFRTKPAPKKGGDQGQFDYARLMQDKLGFVYGPYNNYTDFAPVNEFWRPDLIARSPDNQLQGAWMRCYAPKPAYAVEYCAKLAPIIQQKFHFSTAYCDVHTAVAPWDRTDYDARVPGAGTFAATFYSYGEIMLHQKGAWQGPVYSEGGHHAFYCGLTDGNYGQDQGYGIPNHPWLVDFDLRKIHDLCCNFGIGNPGMFYGSEGPSGTSREAVDAYYDRFFAATVAFGHPGFLTYEGGLGNALRSYYMLQQLHSSYTLSSAAEIRYADEKGRLPDTSAAVASGAYQRSQVVTRYANGTVTAANGSRTERMGVDAFGRQLDLPPNGYAGWTKDGSVDVLSGDSTGWRTDYSVSPAYIYVDGRGRFVRFPKAAGNGAGICRILPGKKHEIIPYQDAECGFAIDAASAVALDKDSREIGPTKLRLSRGLTYVEPVKGAFSYMLSRKPAAGAVALTCGRDDVVAGEHVTVRGAQGHELVIPKEAKVGDRVWREFEGAMIDFTVVPVADAQVALDGDNMKVSLTSNLPKAGTASVSTAGKTASVRLEPHRKQTVAIDLGVPQEETAETLTISVKTGDMTEVIERGMLVENTTRPLVPMAEKWQAGMRVRGKDETTDFGTTAANCQREAATCGDIAKSGLTMCPPWQGAVGYGYVLYDPTTLPATPAAALRAFVGKRDGSDPGDGILYKVTVTDSKGNETVIAEKTVTQHEWTTIEGDLSPWAGQSVRIRLISDVGPNDDSIGDWACWADMRVETLRSGLYRTLQEQTERFRREAGPSPVAGLTLHDLRSARAGRLVYDGCGLEGTGDPYGSFAVLNGVELGHMRPAGGDAVHGVWAERVSVPLTPEAIKNLTYRNRFVIRNPGQDSYKVRRFHIELELADGRKATSDISTATYTQPGDWLYSEGIGVPFGTDVNVDIWFRK